MNEVVYENPATKGDAGSRLNAQLETDGKDPMHFVRQAKRQADADRQARKKYDANWDRYRRYYGGDHWFNKLRPATRARPAPNYIFADIETIIPIMMDKQPTINVVAKKEKNAALADLVQDGVRAVFTGNTMQTKSVYVLKGSHIYGTGISKQSYNPRRKRIEITPIDTRNFFLSDGCVEIQEARRVSVITNRLVADMEEDFPHIKGKIGKGAAVLDEALTHKPVDAQKLYEQDKAYVINSDSGEMMNAQDGTGSDDSNTAVATQIETWSRDASGQVWVTIVCGEALARRSKSPYWNGRANWPGGSKYPFARNLCYPIPSQFWGMGEVQMLESPQDMINRAEAQIADLGRLCTSPYMLIHRRSRVSLKDITNRIASFIVWDGETPPAWMQPPGVSSDLFQITGMAKKHMDNMSSVQDASRGELPADRISGVAIKQLQQATGGRVKLKTTMFEEYLCEVARQVIDLMKQYYANETIRVGGKYRQINTQDKNTGNFEPQTDISLGDYDVEIGVGSTLPVDKGVRFEQASQMFQMQAISRKTLYQKSGMTEEEILEAEQDLEAEKIKDADLQIKIQSLAQASMAQAAPPPEGEAGGAVPGGAAPPAAPPGNASGDADLDGIVSELDQLEAAPH